MDKDLKDASIMCGCGAILIYSIFHTRDIIIQYSDKYHSLKKEKNARTLHTVLMTLPMTVIIKIINFSYKKNITN